MFLICLPSSLWAQYVSDTDSVAPALERQVQELEVVARRSGLSRMNGAMNGMVIGRDELFKAACCNLGESFTTNPSVDVNYSDATTGARQVKLLGLSGIYVQMLTENLPNFRGAAQPYALGYVPGPWMKSIQVSKGASSVRNGYESMTGQINVQYLQPEDEEGVTVNVFGNTKGRLEANADGNAHLNQRLSTEILLHYENNQGHHDENHDTFLDQPRVRQYNLQNRWAYLGSSYIFHGGFSLLEEKRRGGQTHHTLSSTQMSAVPLFGIDIDTHRYEAYMKHAVVLDKEHGTNIALMSSASMHEQQALYGRKVYDVNEKNVYAQLMFETTVATRHNLSTGFSFNHDYFGQHYRLSHDTTLPIDKNHERETTGGAYAQYTYNWNERFIAMTGVRVDHSSKYGTFFTPRAHVKWQVNDVLGLRASIGKGYRSPHALAENNYLLASGRTLVIMPLRQESAWNYGISTQLNIPLANETLKLNAEYYYTRFHHQALIDYDTNPEQIIIDNLSGKSYSHTFQIDATYPFFKCLTLTAAWRWNDVKATYGGQLLRKPLTSKYKGLLTASYNTPLKLWQVDVTLQLNGGGRLPRAYQLSDGTRSWSTSYHAFCQLQAQVTRWFRHFSIYVGGENLTGFKQRNPIIGYDNPWGTAFEPTLIYGPLHGAVGYIGIRVNFGRL